MPTTSTAGRPTGATPRKPWSWWSRPSTRGRGCRRTRNGSEWSPHSSRWVPVGGVDGVLFVRAFGGSVPRKGPPRLPLGRVTPMRLSILETLEDSLCPGWGLSRSLTDARVSSCPYVEFNLGFSGGTENELRSPLTPGLSHSADTFGCGVRLRLVPPRSFFQRRVGVKCLSPRARRVLFTLRVSQMCRRESGVSS